MIKPFRRKKTQEFLSVLHFIKENPDSDFYFTKNNGRAWITTEKLFNSFLSNVILNYYYEENDECKGLIVVWKSESKEQNLKRFYVKLLANSSYVAEGLLRNLSWNYFNEIFAKIRKDHPYLNLFKKFGWQFRGGRGKQILLRKAKQIPPKKQFIKDEQ